MDSCSPYVRHAAHTEVGSSLSLSLSMSEALTFTYPFSPFSAAGDELFKAAAVAAVEVDDDGDTIASAPTAVSESLLCKPPRDRFFRRNTFPLFSTTSVIAHAHKNVSSSGGNIDQTGCFIDAEHTKTNTHTHIHRLEQCYRSSRQ